jgi:multidrug transporter EmrE-like cation transporter
MHTAKAWTCLILAILCETSGTMCMRMVNRHVGWYVPAYCLYAAAFALFPSVLESMSLAVAYTTWSVIGSVLVGLASVICFNERVGKTNILGMLGCALCVPLLHVKDTPPAIDNSPLLAYV